MLLLSSSAARSVGIARAAARNSAAGASALREQPQETQPPYSGPMNPRVRRLIVSGVLGGLVLIVVCDCRRLELAPVTLVGAYAPIGKKVAERDRGMSLIRGSKRAGLLLLAAMLLAILPMTAVAEDTLAFRIKDARITESSGLAVDPAGNSIGLSTIRATAAWRTASGLTGSPRNAQLPQPNLVDVEAVAVHKDRLYVADIGDNNARRSFVRVYFFDNPRANGLTVSYHAYDFRYPDGPHNAETLLVNDSGPAVHRDERQRRCHLCGSTPAGPSRCQ